MQNKLYPEHFELKDTRPCKYIDPETNKCGIYNSRHESAEVIHWYSLSLEASP